MHDVGRIRVRQRVSRVFKTPPQNYTYEPSDNREAHITHQRVQAAAASVPSLVYSHYTRNTYTHVYCTHENYIVTLYYISVYDFNIYKIYATHRHEISRVRVSLFFFLFCFKRFRRVCVCSADCR